MVTTTKVNVAQSAPGRKRRIYTMTDRHDGGPAFPVAAHPVTDIYGYDTSSGMSLRDWFAGQAMAGLLRDNRTGCANFDRQDQLSRLAYQMADAMLAARSEDKP